jgi:protein TonB
MIRLQHSETAVQLALLSVALVTPAYELFFDPIAGIARNVGSAPNPTPQDIRQNLSAAYPLISRSRNEQGTVGLRISVTASGAVSGAVVQRTSGFQRLDDAAVNYVMARWPYRATAQDRQGLPAEMLIDVTFRLG